MKKYTSGMTLLEVLVVMAIVVTLIIAVIVLIKPQEQINKAMDAKRKHELNEMRKVFEDWYTDRSCYPKMDEVCYNSLSTTTCEICSSEAGSPSLNAYTTSELCDPQSPVKNYLYQIQGDETCPSSYIIYTKLSAQYNPSEDLWGCGGFHGCGPYPFYGYDYLVSSPNAPISRTSNYYCFDRNSQCTSCGTYESCVNALNDDVCQTIYPSRTACCTGSPYASNCN
jgi:type II secretory pathway pseudopilin PulG